MVIAVVVVLLARLLTLVRRIGILARDIVAGLEDVQAGTAPVPKVEVLNEHLESIVQRAATARSVLPG